jgi:glycosyltransferase involved in cell wall biosynthesis
LRKVMILGDSPVIKTGFGSVNARAVKVFQEAGWSVASVAGLSTEVGQEIESGIRMYYPDEDVLGLSKIRPAVADFQPDLIYMTADAGTALVLAASTPQMPCLMYIPIEGEPIGNKDWRGLIQSLPVVTCSAYGAKIIKRDAGRDVPYIYHGVDHDVFKVNGNREEVRKRLGWTDKFVITAVSTNVRRKQLPRLIEAVSILRQRYHIKDIVLYLHTVPFQGYWLEGHNLPEVAEHFGVEDIVVFNQEMQKRNDSIPEVSYEKDGQWRPGLVDLYNASDLLVNPSQVEGFGMPIAEAMACGVPVLVTKYAAGWEIAQPAGRGIPVIDYEIHKSTTLYANVDIQALAKEILRLKNSPKERERMSLLGLERVKDFSWEIFGRDILRHAEEAIDAYQERSEKQQETGEGEEESPEGNDIRRDEVNDTTEASDILIDGTREVVDDQTTQDQPVEEEKEDA